MVCLFLGNDAVCDVKKVLKKNDSKSVGTAIENLLKTGRLASESPLDLPQVSTISVCMFCFYSVLILKLQICLMRS